MSSEKEPATTEPPAEKETATTEQPTQKETTEQPTEQPTTEQPTQKETTEQPTEKETATAERPTEKEPTQPTARATRMALGRWRKRAEQVEGTVKDLQRDIEALKTQLRARGHRPIGRIALAFSVPGVLSLVFSIIVNSAVLAFMGLGLTFWGALFFLVRPTAYVSGDLLALTAESFYLTVGRIVKDLNCRGRAVYIPPYPREVYLPEHLRGLKETVAFISVNENTTMPSVEEMARSKFVTKNPEGICLIPPGSSLLDQIERVLRADITKTSLEDLCATLPQLIHENFQFVREIQMKTENSLVYLKMTNSIYQNLYLKEELKTVRLLGCPLASAIAGAIAKNTGKPTYIQSSEISADARTVQVAFGFMET